MISGWFWKAHLQSNTHLVTVESIWVLSKMYYFNNSSDLPCAPIIYIGPLWTL